MWGKLTRQNVTLIYSSCDSVVRLGAVFHQEFFVVDEKKLYQKRCQTEALQKLLDPYLCTDH